ncbi:MAG: OmpA family protein [Cellulomonas sp.]|nr:OmpA family protein [Cellulomonas sp.]
MLEATVYPIERAGDHVVLTVDYSIPESSESDTELRVQDYMEDCVLCWGTSTVRLVDLSEGYVWRPGYAWSEGHTDVTLTKQSQLRVSPGQTVTSVTFFGECDADEVDVLIEFVGMAMDVPVVDGDADTPGLSSLGLEDPLFGDYDEEESVLVYPDPFPLESVIESYDDGASLEKQGENQTVVMSSDVLFGSDVAELSDEAAARVDAVAEQIAEAATGGEVRVVGHTDDVDTEDYNMDLSARRAASVAERLGAMLDTSFTVVEEGKGESQPRVEGKDSAARAANRRVEIAFTSADAIALPGDVSDIPEATVPVSSGHDPVTYADAYSGDTTVTSHVSSVVRHDGYLVGTLVAANNSDSSSLGPMYGVVCNRSLDAECLELLGPNGRVFPAQHKSDWSESDYRVGLVDDNHIQFLSSGYSFAYTIVWPDTGENSVTIESPGVFRITDIPVEEPR